MPSREVRARRLGIPVEQLPPIDRIGPKNPHWRGGRVRGTDGRMMIYMPGHHLANLSGGVYALEYRVIAEEKIKRRLKKGEIVHHINGDKNDNRPENLEVLTQAEHARKHFTGCKRPDRKTMNRDPKTGRILPKQKEKP